PPGAPASCPCRRRRTGAGHSIGLTARSRDAPAENVSRAVAAELDAAEPLRDNAYKVPLAHRLAGAVVGGLAGTHRT
ncbi:hypothetical protein ACE14D_24180, partial [Streptomyces sp. Act-28]